MSDCCEKCKYLATLWYWKNGKKQYGHCCTMLAKTESDDGEEVYVHINNPDSDICEMFAENKEFEVNNDGNDKNSM